MLLIRWLKRWSTTLLQRCYNIVIMFLNSFHALPCLESRPKAIFWISLAKKVLSQGQCFTILPYFKGRNFRDHEKSRNFVNKLSRVTIFEFFTAINFCEREVLNFFLIEYRVIKIYNFISKLKYLWKGKAKSKSLVIMVTEESIPSDSLYLDSLSFSSSVLIYNFLSSP